MQKAELERLIDVAAGREPGDLLIKNCQIVDVGLGRLRNADILICGEYIAATGKGYAAKEIWDAQGLYALPGLMDAHIHIESSYLCPEEFARLAVPLGTTTVIADPHEIVNVAGLEGLEYMQEAARHTPLKIEYMLPSCVPSTAFENAGAVLKATDIASAIGSPDLLGLAELMNFPGVVDKDPEVIAKILAAKAANKVIDGHSPGLTGKALAAYAAAGIHSDHECSSLEEMEERLSAGIYVLLRYGSSCHDLETLVEGITPQNSSRCLFCSDDRHAATMLRHGHMNQHLALAVSHGIEPVSAVQMASLNTALAYGLKERGGIFPGYKADIVLVEDLEKFKATQVWIDGQLCASEGKYLAPLRYADSQKVRASFHLKDFSAERLKFKLEPHKQLQLRVLEIQPGSVLTKAGEVSLYSDASGDLCLPPEEDVVRLAVVERHHATGNVGLGLLRGYGLRCGAIASSIAHDSHNIMLAGRSPQDMALAAETLATQEGGLVLVQDGQVIASLPLPLGGLMAALPAAELSQRLHDLEELAHTALGISREIDPVMTLSFMSLLVIPELKLSDEGLFDVSNFKLVDIEI